MINIYAYKNGSESARLLRDAMDVKLIRKQGSRYTPGPRKVIINWGATEMPDAYRRSKVINKPECVRNASNKLRFFRAMEGKDYVPEYTTNIDVARSWINSGHRVCCRTVTAGHSARGLVLASTLDDLVPAPLYTKYIPKQDEYRVHVVSGAIVDVQRKARSRQCDNPNWQIRTHENGFVFSRQNVQAPPQVEAVAHECIGNLGLDFGGVDVIWNSRQQKAYVLEINTAWGIEGTTVQTYARELRNLADEAQRGRYFDAM